MDNKFYLKQLKLIRDRYFRPVIKNKDGLLVHHGDCNIYRSKKIYGFAPCTCGLLHDLKFFTEEFIEIIYPQYWDERVKSDMTYEDEKNHKPLNQDAVDAFFSIFGMYRVIEERNFEDSKRYWKIIQKVFPPTFIKYLREQHERTTNINNEVC